MGYSIGMPELLSMLRAELDDLPDERKPSNNTKYTVEEALLSAFSVFLMQSKSFLDHQRLMKSQKGRDNLASLFGIENIPCDNQIRNLLDPVPASTVLAVFRSVDDALSKTGALSSYRCFQGESCWFSMERNISRPIRFIVLTAAIELIKTEPPAIFIVL